jgi:hypothetical protein
MGRGGGLVDILDRILDKGLCIAGDIRVSLADVELLTIRIRLIICSVDKAEKIGMDWWRSDPYFSPSALTRGPEETRQLTEKIADIDAKLAALMKAVPGIEQQKPHGGQQGHGTVGV